MGRELAVGEHVADACRAALTRWGVPGAVVGTLVGGETTVRAYGVADVRTGEGVREDATFRIASITKTFTATLALSLADDGLLDLDEEVPLDLPAGSVTLRHLLAHLGGFEGELGDLARFGDGDDALAAAVRELPRLQRIVPPGSWFSYCNAGYWAVAAVCAERLGKTYEEGLRERVLAPLGLAQSSFGEPEVTGHVQPEPGSPRHDPAPPKPYPRARRPSGGLASTAPDLLRFAEALLRDGGLARLREPLAEVPGGAYGLGLAGERVGELELWGHDGAYGGFRSRLALVPERACAFAILTNGDAGEAVVREVADSILEHACGVRREPPPTEALAREALDVLAGRYATAEVEADVRREEDRLTLDLVFTSPVDGERTAVPTVTARPVGGRTFAVVGGQWDEDLFDFVPRDGAAEFLRIGGRLTPRA